MNSPDLASWSPAPGGTGPFRAYAVIDGGDAVVTIPVNEPDVDMPTIWAVFWHYFTIVPTGGQLTIELDLGGVVFQTDIVRAYGGSIYFFTEGINGGVSDEATVTLAQGTSPGQAGRIIVVYTHEIIES